MGDKFARPQNHSYQLGEHAKIVASGKRAAQCPGCHEWRWFNQETLQMPDYLCDHCILGGVPRKAVPLAKRGELTPAQRAKKV